MARTVEILAVAQRQLDELAKKNARDTRTIDDAIFDSNPRPGSVIGSRNPGPTPREEFG